MCIALKQKDVNLKQHLMFKVRMNISTTVDSYFLFEWFQGPCPNLTTYFPFHIEDPPKIDLDALGKFSKPVIVKAGESAEWKLPFSGGAPMTIYWYKDDDELLTGLKVKIDTSSTQSQLRLSKCQRKDSGEVKIKIKNEFGTIEATSKFIVLGE